MSTRELNEEKRVFHTVATFHRILPIQSQRKNTKKLQGYIDFHKYHIQINHKLLLFYFVSKNETMYYI